MATFVVVVCMCIYKYLCVCLCAFVCLCVCLHICTRLSVLVYPGAVDGDCNTAAIVASSVSAVLLLIAASYLYFWYYFYVRPNRVKLVCGDVDQGEHGKKEQAARPPSTFHSHSMHGGLAGKQTGRQDTTWSIPDLSKEFSRGSLKRGSKNTGRRTLNALPVSMGQYLGKRSDSKLHKADISPAMPPTAFVMAEIPGTPLSPSGTRKRLASTRSTSPLPTPGIQKLVDEGIYASSEEVTSKKEKYQTPEPNKNPTPEPKKPTPEPKRHTPEPKRHTPEPKMRTAPESTARTSSIYAMSSKDGSRRGSPHVSPGSCRPTHSTADSPIPTADNNPETVTANATNDIYTESAVKMECIYNDLPGLDELMGERLEAMNAAKYAQHVSGHPKFLVPSMNEWETSSGELGSSPIPPSFKKALDDMTYPSTSIPSEFYQLPSALLDDSLSTNSIKIINTINDSCPYQLPSALLKASTLASPTLPVRTRSLTPSVISDIELSPDGESDGEMPLEGSSRKTVYIESSSPTGSGTCV